MTRREQTTTVDRVNEATLRGVTVRQPRDLMSVDVGNPLVHESQEFARHVQILVDGGASDQARARRRHERERTLHVGAIVGTLELPSFAFAMRQSKGVPLARSGRTGTHTRRHTRTAK